MKGTAPRAGTPEADALVRRQLAADVKQRAENLMIVDLMRNDIGRIAEIGSVERHRPLYRRDLQTLHQMTSGVRATLKEGVGTAELLRGIFPPGSIIGAPKIRAMELIRQLETEPRGVYCGAIGYISPEGARAVQRRHPHRRRLPQRRRRDGHRLGRGVRSAKGRRNTPSAC